MSKGRRNTSDEMTTVSITVQEFLESTYTLGQLLGAKPTAANSKPDDYALLFRLGNLRAAVRPHMAEDAPHNEVLGGLRREYGREVAPGVWSVDQQCSPENIAAFNERTKPVLAQSIQLTFKPLPVTDLQRINELLGDNALSGDQVGLLLWVFEG